jgi:hypothetical protein
MKLNFKFNSKFQSYSPRRFNIGKHNLKEVDSYCYLGIAVHKSGSFSIARAELMKKAMRSMYGLKCTINKSMLTKPVALYGAPIVTPNMSILKHISNLSSANTSKTSLLKKIILLNCEKVRLNFLQWPFAVNRKSVNSAIWGETGRFNHLSTNVSIWL